MAMKTITEEQAQVDLPRLLEQTASSHEPVQINGKTARAVLVSEDGWRAIEETPYLLSVPGMRESSQEGMRTPPDQCLAELP